MLSIIPSYSTDWLSLAFLMIFGLWLGDCSDRFPVNQGVRQGGILSTPLYKVYVHPLLDILKNKRLGFRFGTVYIGSPAVADDAAYLTRLKYELQLMFQWRREWFFC